MSYFIVPAVLYQTQQKLKQSKDAKKKKSGSSSSSSSSSSDKKHRHHRQHRAGSIGSGSPATTPGSTSSSTPVSETGPGFLSHSVRSRSTENYDGQSLHSGLHLTRIKETADVSETHSMNTNNTSVTDLETLHNDAESDNYSFKYHSDLISLHPVSQPDGNLKLISPPYVSAVGVPIFNVITDLSVLNHEGYGSYFYAPSYQTLIYEHYLSFMSDVRPSDPITFAGIRLQNICNAIERLAQSNSNQLKEDLACVIPNNKNEIAKNFAEDQLADNNDDDEEGEDTKSNRSLPESNTNLCMDQISPSPSITKAQNKTVDLGRSGPTTFLGRATAQIQGSRLQAPSIDMRYHLREQDVIKEFDTIRVGIEVQDPELRMELEKLTFKLLQMKQFIRTYICNLFCENTFPSEGCLVANFVNYIRYLLYLPVLEVEQYKQLNEVELAHYANRRILSSFVGNTKLRGKLQGIPLTEDFIDFSPSNTNTSTCNFENILESPENMEYLLHAVKRSANDFVKLETYHLSLLTKFNNNSLTDIRILTKMFDKFVRFKQLQQQSSNKGGVHTTPSFVSSSNISTTSSSSIPTLSSQVRVLNFNKLFSSQYGWYMALRMPFANIYEHNTNFQHQEKINGAYAVYNIEQEQTSKVSLQSLDLGSTLLQANFYKKLQEINSHSLWLSYRLMTNEQFVLLSRESQRQNSNIPANFQYYCGTLAQLGANSFDLIHSRDLQFQVTSNNMKTIIREFYRILKPEGVLECPVIQYCSKTDKLQFFNIWDYLGIELDLNYKIIPNYVEVLTSELVEVFGSEYVKIGVAPLNTKNEMNMYLLKHAALQAYEASGQLSAFCASQRDFDDVEGSHVLVSIQATKKV